MVRRKSLGAKPGYPQHRLSVAYIAWITFLKRSSVRGRKAGTTAARFEIAGYPPHIGARYAHALRPPYLTLLPLSPVACQLEEP